MQIHSNVEEPWRVRPADTGERTQTGGRIRRIRSYVEGQPFLMTYSDGIGNVDLNALIGQHKQSGMAATLTAI